MDDKFADVSLLTCTNCRQNWLKYFYEVEAFTASGRWYLGAITAGLAASVTADEAKAVLEGLSWYYCGGSYYAGEVRKVSGTITLHP